MIVDQAGTLRQNDNVVIHITAIMNDICGGTEFFYANLQDQVLIFRHFSTFTFSAANACNGVFKHGNSKQPFSILRYLYNKKEKTGQKNACQCMAI